MSLRVSACLKKRKGEFQLTSRLKWIETGQDSASFDVGIDMIKSLFVNPPTSDKILLKITVLTSPDKEASYTFSFSNTTDRELLKDKLSELMRLAAKGNEVVLLRKEDIEARQTLLSNDKVLAELHLELVIGKKISEEEFWEGRKVIYKSIFKPSIF